MLEPFTVSVKGLWGKTDAKLNKQMLQKRVAYMEPILSKCRTNCAEVEIDAGQMFVLPFCAKPFKVSVHGLLLPVRLMHKLNKQVVIGELPDHNIESSC